MKDAILFKNYVENCLFQEPEMNGFWKRKIITCISLNLVSRKMADGILFYLLKIRYQNCCHGKNFPSRADLVSGDSSEG